VKLQQWVQPLLALSQSNTLSVKYFITTQARVQLERQEERKETLSEEDAVDLTIFMIVPLPMTNCAGIFSFPVRPLK